MADYALIVTCEHGGNKIPKPYRRLFEKHCAVLDSHRSYDLGALKTARLMARHFNAPLFEADTSRLLVDLNRSLGHPQLFSWVTRILSDKLKNQILSDCYNAHRDPIEDTVRKRVASEKTVLHIACHSFAPILKGCVRSMHIGLLYDPHRESEKMLCRNWKRSMIEIDATLKIRSNAPYRGVSDGLATYLRRHFQHRYLGIELELNQGVFHEGPSHWRKLNETVIKGLTSALKDLPF